MILTALALVAAQADMRPIELPYQAIPAFRAYTTCVGARFRESVAGRGDAEEAREAVAAAVAACRAAREEQLASALAAVADTRTQLDRRTYRSRAEAQVAVRRAFDRFDSDFEVEAAHPPLVSNVPLSPAGHAEPEEEE